MLLSVISILAGFFLLVKGGDYLVEGASAVARYANLSPMIIGLTVVGFGTSFPELLVSTQAALAGSPGIAIGNVVGSNIANIALILGVTALIHELPIKRTTLHLEIPFTILATALFMYAALEDGVIEQWEGFVMAVLLLGFVSWQIRDSRSEVRPDDIILPEHLPLWRAILYVIGSFAALVFGADLLISGSSDMARTIGDTMGVDPASMEQMIGLTIVAVGTSLPELFASVMAARKGETDMAIGNIVGSVTFNLLFVVGVASIVCPIEGAADKGFLLSYIIMAALTPLLWVFMRTSYRLERWEGFLLLAIYIGFLVCTILKVEI